MFKVKRLSGVFIVIFEHISHLFLVFLLLTLKKWMLAGNMPRRIWDHINPSNIYLFKVNNKNIRKRINVILLSLLLTLNIFYTSFEFFYCWPWASKYFLGDIYLWWNLLAIFSKNSFECLTRSSINSVITLLTLDKHVLQN